MGGLVKRIAFFLLLVFLSVPPGPALAAEAQATQSVLSLDEEDFLAEFPLFYSYESGEWITSSPGKIFTTGEVPPDFTLPSLRGKPAPIRYPLWALGHNWEGGLVVAVEIIPAGAVGRWKVMHSSGHPALDRAAVRAIQKWRFEPGRLKGKPIASCIQIPIRFVIDRD